MEEIADFLGVAVRSVRRWVAAFRDHGDEGLALRAGAGRRPKLTAEQTHTVLAWLQDSPTTHGFRHELWTAQRVGECIRQQWGISFNRRYLSAWLRDRAITPPVEKTSSSGWAWTRSNPPVAPSLTPAPGHGR